MQRADIEGKLTELVVKFGGKKALNKEESIKLSLIQQNTAVEIGKLESAKTPFEGERAEIKSEEGFTTKEREELLADVEAREKANEKALEDCRTTWQVKFDDQKEIVDGIREDMRKLTGRMTVNCRILLTRFSSSTDSLRRLGVPDEAINAALVGAKIPAEARKEPDPQTPAPSAVPAAVQP